MMSRHLCNVCLKLVSSRSSWRWVLSMACTYLLGTIISYSSLIAKQEEVKTNIEGSLQLRSLSDPGVCAAKTLTESERLVFRNCCVRS